MCSSELANHFFCEWMNVEIRVEISRIWILRNVSAIVELLSSPFIQSTVSRSTSQKLVGGVTRRPVLRFIHLGSSQTISLSHSPPPPTTPDDSDELRRSRPSEASHYNPRNRSERRYVGNAARCINGRFLYSMRHPKIV